MHLVLLAMTCTLAVGAAAQSCARPTPPPGGFALQLDPQVPVTYSDAYETFGTMQWPAGPAPSCGWPLVVHVHQLGGTRFDDAPLQSLLASQGYAVWSYDVRGQGQAVAANVGHPQGGTTLWGAIERHDLAEQVAAVAGVAAWQGVVDTTRVAVIGKSQGGAHAWQAAAWSGETLQTPGRASAVSPVVGCVVAYDLVADPIDDWVRGGQLFSSWWIEAISGSYQGVPFDQTMVQNGRNAFLAQDPTALAATLTAEGHAVAARLATSSVPVLYGHAYHDVVDGPLSGIERLESMQGPRRAMLSTVGHGVPTNVLEEELRRNMAVRWLHRFLWDDANDVDVEVPHVLASLPLAAAQRADPAYAWSRMHVGELDPPATAERFHLHDDFELRSTEPAGPAVTLPVEQVIDPLATNFLPFDYLDQAVLRELPNVLAVCPLDERVWSLTLPGDVQLVRSAALHLHLVPQDAAWMLAAMLTVEPPGGDEVLLCSQGLASRGSVAGVDEVRELRMPPIAVQLPAGTIVRLRLSNLWLREFPLPQHLEVAPMFTDFRVDVVTDAGVDSSWLDLPIEALAPRLVVDRMTVDLDSAQPVAATLRGGLGRAGFPYFVAVGLSGQSPATPYLNDLVPIEGDWLVVASVGSTAGTYYQDFLGFLDANGEASCGFDFSSAAPLPQLLNGYQLTLAAFVWDGSFAPTGAATNSCDVLLK